MGDSPEYHAAHLSFARAAIVEAAANREPILDRLRAYSDDVAKACRDEHDEIVDLLREALENEDVLRAEDPDRPLTEWSKRARAIVGKQ